MTTKDHPWVGVDAILEDVEVPITINPDWKLRDYAVKNKWFIFKKNQKNLLSEIKNIMGQ